MGTGGRKRGSHWLLGGALLAIAIVFAIAPGISFAANPSASLAQCANDPLPSSHFDGCSASATDWVSGNLGNSKSVYFEGDYIPYRLILQNLAPGPHSVTIEWDTTKSSKHAIDYIGTVTQTVATANPCLGVNLCSSGTFSAKAIPKDPQVDNGSGVPITQAAGEVRLYGTGATLNNFSTPSSVGSTACTAANTSGSYCYSTGKGFSGDKSAAITVNFTTTAANPNPVLAWGGHIATRKDWGNGNSAVAISGSPYHTRLIDLDGSGGNQDRSLSAAAVIFPGFIHIVKNTTGGNATFPFTASPSPLSNFSLTTVSGTAEKDFNDISNFTTYTVAEGTLPTNWAFDNASCSVATGTDNGGSRTTSGKTATINLAEGEQVTCTYANHFVAAPGLTVDKTSTDTTFDSVGDVLHYSYLVTNTGNVPLTGVSVTDDNIDDPPGMDCPSTTIAVGGTLTCTAQHTVTQTDLDACKVINNVSVTSTEGATGSDSLEIDGSCTPHLAITKDFSPASYSAVGDVISYTIVATNDGNVTLHNVTVTDPNGSNLSCTPSIPVTDLAPGDTISCTADHTVTQADLDAGHYANQACVNDGAGGADEACDDVDTPGTQNPAITIDKASTTTLITAAGQVVPYTYVVTNTGNVTLTGITVTDDKVATVTCPKTTLVPAEHMTCTGSHTVTSAEISAGGNLVNLAEACGNPPVGDAVCDDDTVSIPIQPPRTGQITPTNTTCSQFNSGSAKTLDTIQYSVKSGKISQVNPGVFFYYIKVNAVAGNNTFVITQSITTGNFDSNFFAPASGSNVYTSNCTTVGGVTITQSGATTTIKFNAASAGTYIIGQKYNSGTVVGKTAPSPTTVHYTFEMGGVSGSLQGLDLVKK